MKKGLFVFIGICAVFVSVLTFLPSVAYAAGSLVLSPPTGVYTAGSTFTVRVLVNTDGQAINAAEGEITFNPSELSVVAVSQAGSIFNLWTVEPTYSNGAGTISFGGGSPKGYTGSSGTVITITFRALKETSATVRFSSGLILAADGKGTNIIGALSSGSYTLQSSKQTPPPEIVVPDNSPSAPAVVSSTHPNETKWYPLTDAKLSWEVPDSVSAVRLLIDQTEYTIPTVFYGEPISEKLIEDLDNGEWYFHAQFRNADGWGKVRHFRIGVDTELPSSFEIREPEDRDPTSPNTQLIFDATDEVSGIARYEIQIGNDEPIVWIDTEGDGLYTLPTLPAGKHTLIVKAFDGADNYLVQTKTVTIVALGAPTFTEYPDTISTDTILVMRGTAIPNSTVTVWTRRGGEEPVPYTLTSDADGGFTFISDNELAKGVHTFWATVTDERGAQSEPSAEVKVVVRDPGYVRIGSFALSILSLIVPLVGVIALLVFLFWYTRHKIILLRKRLNKEVFEAEAALHKAFITLQKGAEKQVKALEAVSEKRKLTAEEKDILANLKKNLTQAEKAVAKEIEDIEKVLKSN
ncbi:MAG: Ig-like domain-containing protein [Candidatus Paceibacterota bacterium]